MLDNKTDKVDESLMIEQLAEHDRFMFCDNVMELANHHDDKLLLSNSIA